MAQKGLCPSSRTANTILIPEHPGFLKAFSAQGEQARDEHSSPRKRRFPLPAYLHCAEDSFFYNAGQFPSSMPSNRHSYMVLAIVCVCALAICAFLSWQNREKKTGWRSSTRNFPCRRP